MPDTMNRDLAWKVKWQVDGMGKGLLPRLDDDFDPLAVALYKGEALPESRPFVELKKTDPIFRPRIPQGAGEVKIVATDRFGN